MREKSIFKRNFEDLSNENLLSFLFPDESKGTNLSNGSLYTEKLSNIPKQMTKKVIFLINHLLSILEANDAQKYAKIFKKFYEKFYSDFAMVKLETDKDYDFKD